MKTSYVNKILLSETENTISVHKLVFKCTRYLTKTNCFTNFFFLILFLKPKLRVKKKVIFQCLNSKPDLKVLDAK